MYFDSPLTYLPISQSAMAGLPGGASVDVPSAARGGGLRGRDPRLQRPQELHGAQGRPLRLQPLLQAATQGEIRVRKRTVRELFIIIVRRL